MKPSESKKQGREILLSPAAVQELLSSLGSPHYDISSCAIQENGARPAEQTIELVITRKYPNPRLVQARIPATDELVRVMVPSSINFQPGMTITARLPHKKEGPQLYRLEGRCPRYRGRW